MTTVPVEDPAARARRCRDADVLFVPADGFQMAPARVRAYAFADELRKRGLNAQVLSMVDHFTLGDGVPYLPRNNWPSMDRYLLGRSLDLFDVIAQNRKAVLYAQKADLNFFAAGMAKLANGNKLILDYDDNDEAVFFVANPLAEAIADLHPRYALASWAAKSDACVASSAYLFDKLSTYNENTHLIRTVVDTHTFDIAQRGTGAFPEPFDHDRVHLIWPGSVWNDDMVRDLLLMLRCFLDLPSAVLATAQLHLLIFGNKTALLKTMTADMAAARGCPDAVVFHAAVAPAQMPQLLGHMDIGLIFLRDNSFTRAKSPTKMFEYMAMGVAVCATDTGEPGHILEDGVTGMLARDTEEYTGKLERLILDAVARRQMAIRALELIRGKYCMERIGGQLANVLSSL